MLARSWRTLTRQPQLLALPALAWTQENSGLGIPFPWYTQNVWKILCSLSVCWVKPYIQLYIRTWEDIRHMNSCHEKNIFLLPSVLEANSLCQKWSLYWGSFQNIVIVLVGYYYILLLIYVPYNCRWLLTIANINWWYRRLAVDLQTYKEYSPSCPMF